MEGYPSNKLYKCVSYFPLLVAVAWPIPIGTLLFGR